MSEGNTGAARRGRVHFLDEWRGLSLLMMVVYHGLYDLVYIFGVQVPGMRTVITPYIQPFIAGSFIFIAGISCRFSRSNWKRGLLTIGLGVGVSLVTYFFMPSQMIWFGILHFLGTAMLLFGLAKPLLDRIPARWGFAAALLLFLATLDVPQGTLGFRFLPGIALPEVEGRWLLPLGFNGAGSDYFPLLPWLFLFLAGAYCGTWFTSGKAPEWFYRPHLPRLAAIGRRTIIIYVIHQPLLYGILWLIFS